jgi:hypothetical protein
MAVEQSYGKMVTDGLVLYLNAADRNSYVSGSSVWRDLGGNNISGSLINGPSFSSVNGGSIVFDGVDDYAQISNNSAINFGSGGFTIECVFKPNSTQLGGNFPAVINKSTGDFTSPALGVTGWILFWRTSSNIYQFSLGDSSSTVNTVNFPTSINNDNTWRNISVTIPSGSNLINGYYNGVLVASTTRTLTGSTDINVNLTIGTWREFGRELNVELSIAKIYNRALSAQEILQNYNATKTRFGLT